MASIKEATENALKFAVETLGPERATDARLEEIESTRVSREDAWLITLSMVDPDANVLSAFKALGGKRAYKSFAVRKQDGEVLSMKIRELADV